MEDVVTDAFFVVGWTGMHLNFKPLKSHLNHLFPPKETKGHEWIAVIIDLEPRRIPINDRTERRS